MERLNEGRKVFIHDFLMPEIKRISKEMGFKNYPTPNFEDLDLRDNSKKNKDWEPADIIRDKLSEINIQIKDTRDGTNWELNE